MLNVNSQDELDERLAPLNQDELVRRVNEILGADEPHEAKADMYSEYFIADNCHMRERHEYRQVFSCIKPLLNSWAIETPTKYVLCDDTVKRTLEAIGKAERQLNRELNILNERIIQGELPSKSEMSGENWQELSKAAYFFGRRQAFIDALDQHEVAILAIKEKPLSEARHEKLLYTYPYSQAKKATLYSTL